MRIDKKDNKWVYEKRTPPTRDGTFSPRIMSVPSLSCSTSVFLALFPARRSRTVDAPCSFEKGVKIGVGGVCLGVIGAEPKTIYMAKLTFLLVRNPWRPVQPDTGL
ncbi:unnamed protein product [Strongylus vulgaris]|uniref:Uncharacterized protein n=1 Tax=Strongylus vulgaris TaxID=40348 RepID=A0A3P7I873_STRVU|nr:unnamed protein product [Strongylus vulgaris]